MHPGIAHLAPTQHGLHGGNPATRFTYGWLADLATYRLSRESAVLGPASASGERCPRPGWLANLTSGSPGTGG